ncbi:GNAT family N-acetyltransferase [Rickettsiales endosymbiont of Stachyamoeba lipophora]|uniref:GNAT family N-acetyltransferase n=1 Tax=Rickettsiales endosymbiont of Stachyamoeba lipophora TaxID=2486578 RepID=UPI000F645AEF|nr:GNAT family N-acetyltransferase [Rickettsiales endosymbiont of Stachyamoeba lipophora]AZL15770.1 GNAT family N-acetyltransferase [Rickettsiales endosymbiont of Stachyamoeba lipophora]
MNYKITSEPPSSITSKIIPELITLAQEQKGLKPFKGVAFAIRDHKNEILAGTTAVIYYGCMFIELLWVDPHHRKKGLASSLVKRLEQVAKDNNCNMITITTMDWEAKPLYEKLGYFVEFERHGYYQESIRYFLRKNLV